MRAHFMPFTRFNVKLAQRFVCSLSRLRERVGEREAGMANFIIKGRLFAVPVRARDMKTYLLCIALLLGWPQEPAQAKVFEHTLKNGLKVIVKEDHRAPVAVQQIWYKAGSMDEEAGVTGIAHVLEHMMFKGTKTVPAGEFSNRIAAAGGRENAFTSYDYTAYFQRLHKSKLPPAMRLEADRMRNLNLTAAELARELNVVMEERRTRTDDEQIGRAHV